jgi:2-methylisocitrate lyase-like PEP mutase family enzyme
MAATRRLRALLEAGKQVVAPGVYDPLSAKAVLSLGFNAVDLGGFASAATLGTMEPLLTMTEQVAIAREITHALGDVPVIADGHTGYGDPVHITRAVREFEAAGVAGIHIEDQVFPKKVGYHRGVKQMVAVGEMQRRIDAAIAARRDDDFLIIARTDARTAEGGSLEEVIARSRAYAEAGAGALMPMPHGRAEATAIRDAIPDIPLVWVGALGKFAEGSEIPLDDLRRIGYQMVLVGVIGICCAIDALTELYRGLKDTGIVDVSRLDEQYENIMKLVEAPMHYEIEESGRVGQEDTRAVERDR